MIMTHHPTSLEIEIKEGSARVLWYETEEIEIKEGSARVLWYETELLIGRPNGGSPKLSKYQRG